jgi:hypothetical protein
MSDSENSLDIEDVTPSMSVSQLHVPQDEDGDVTVLSFEDGASAVTSVTALPLRAKKTWFAVGSDEQLAAVSSYLEVQPTIFVK